MSPKFKEYGDDFMKRNHSDSRKELYFFCQPNNEDVVTYLCDILHYEV